MSQGRVGTNYTQFDRKKFHFGFALGFNAADYRFTINPDSLDQDSIVNMVIRRQPGFNLGIISSYNLNQVIHFRFVPSLSFQERLFVYERMNLGVRETEQTRIEATTLDFPLLLKLRTERIGNFAAYALGGFQYSLDLASQQDVQQKFGEPVVKVKRNDWAYQVGGGFDFWLPYFKFGFLLKLSNGITNLAINDGTFFNRPLGSLKSKVWWFCFTFEG